MVTKEVHVQNYFIEFMYYSESPRHVIHLLHNFKSLLKNYFSKIYIYLLLLSLTFFKFLFFLMATCIFNGMQIYYSARLNFKNI